MKRIEIVHPNFGEVHNRRIVCRWLGGTDFIFSPIIRHKLVLGFLLFFHVNNVIGQLLDHLDYYFQVI